MGAKKTRAEYKERYLGPTIGLGDIVLWYPHYNMLSEPIPATVARLGNENVCLRVHDWNNTSTIIKDGVYHCDDERCRKPEFAETGCWDWTEEWKELQELKKRVKQLEVLNEELVEVER